MSFFYEKKKGSGGSSKRAPDRIPVHIMHERECSLCYLDKKEKDLKTPKFEPSGPLEADVYILGAHPSASEDENGKHFSGETSELLRNYVPSRYKRKVRYNFTSRCHPLSDKDNDRIVQLECCRPSIIQDIEKTKPKVIIGAGNPVLRWAIGKGGQMDSWRGRKIPVKIGNHKCWYVPVYDPTFVYLEGKVNKKSRQRQASKYDPFFKRDIAMACDGVDAGIFDEVPWVEEKDADADCEWIKGHSELDYRKLERFLKKAAEEEICALDLETTELRPYSGGRIISCAVTVEGKTLAFPVQHKRGWRSWNRKFEDKVIELLEWFILNSGAKIWHNMGFDMEWIQEYYGHHVFKDQRYEDTMILAYLLDSRKGMLNLDTLTRVFLGVWLKDQSKVDRANLESEPYEKLLRYNALDTKFTFELFFILEDLLDKEKTLRPNYEEMLDAAVNLILCQDRGIIPNKERMDQFEHQFKTEIKEIEEWMQSLVFIKKFKRKKGTPFQASSPHDVKYLLDDMLNLEHGRKYKGNSKKEWSYTTDEGCLNAIKKEKDPDLSQFADKMLKHRSASKMLSTYIEGMHAVTHDDGLLHTSYSQIFTSTGRLNSSDPNSQNFPKRKMKIIREIIGAPHGFHIVSADYGQIEARVFAMASKDKAFMEALWTGYDVHQAWALKIIENYNEMFDLIADKYELRRDEFNSFSDYEKKVIKALRGDTKNGWVFPQFFGSSPFSCAANMQIPPEIAEKLANEFWGTFTGVKRWQEKTVQFYEKHGYVETLTGKRRWGPLSYNEIINTPIQGTASTIVINAMNVLSQTALEDPSRWYLQPNLNIHDDITLYLPDETIEDDIDFIAKTMTTSRFDFINVPLVAEVEIGPDWGNQYVYGEYSSDSGWAEDAA